ncbi:MAG: hypothetical protein R6X05_09810 [Desulfobacterales bacterium]
MPEDCELYHGFLTVGDCSREDKTDFLGFKPPPIQGPRKEIKPQDDAGFFYFDKAHCKNGKQAGVARQIVRRKNGLRIAVREAMALPDAVSVKRSIFIAGGESVGRRCSRDRLHRQDGQQVAPEGRALIGRWRQRPERAAV